MVLRNLAVWLTCVSADQVSEINHIHIEERRFQDEFGRDRHFRGVNVVYKDPPYLPTVTEFHSNLSFVQDDVDLLAALGVNLIRLGVMWPGVVPHHRGQVEVSYLERIRSLIRMAAGAGIYTIVEPHQDELNPRFCGEGAPDWWVQEFTSVADFPQPIHNKTFDSDPPSREQCLSHSSFSYIWTHDCARAFQTLYEKGADDFGAYWAAVARAFALERSVIGGELWNEPFPGDVFASGGKVRDNKHADNHNLFPFYRNVTRAIREAVPSQHHFALAFEPSWPVGDQDVKPDHKLTPHSGFERLPEEGAIYAFHHYAPPCDGNLTRYLDGRLVDAERLRAVPYASEFNLYAEDAESKRSMAESFEAYESRLISYTGWQYKSYSGSLPDGTCTGCGNSFFHKDGALNTWMSEAIARPFAPMVAGRVSATSFDLDARIYQLEYKLRAHKPTEIVVPDAWLPAAAGELQVHVHGDRAARVTVRSIRGRKVSELMRIPDRRVVAVHHSASAQGGHIKVVVSQSTFTV